MSSIRPVVLRASALAATALVLSAMTVGAAGATSADIVPMALGDAAPAPQGYLAFCARTPDQCGLDPSAEFQGGGQDPESRKRTLVARYFWAVAFGTAPAPAATPVATSVAAAARADEGGALFDAADPGRRFDALAEAASGSAGSAAEPPVTGPADLAQGLLPAAPRPTGMWADAALRLISIDPMREAFGGGGPPAAPEPAAPEAQAAAPVRPLESGATLMPLLDRVNLRINRAIRYVSDQTLYGDEDYWHLPLSPGERGEGDCKDYVLEKRRALIAEGVPAANLSIAIVKTPRGETHAVLLVATDRGELVLDSLSDWIQPWWKVRYTWISRQAPGQQLSWVAINQGRVG